MDIALAGVGVHGHAKAAGGLHQVDGGNDELPCAWVQGEMRGITVPVGGAGQYRAALPVQAEDGRLFVERAEHKRNAAILPGMRRCFVAAADQVHVANGLFIYHPESVEPLGRQVNPAIGAERGRGGKKQVLRFYKVAVVRRDVVGEFSHDTKVG